MLFFFVIPILSSLSRLTLRTMWILRIIKHRRADTVLTSCPFQDVVIDTAVTASPESLVVRQVSEGHRRIP